MITTLIITTTSINYIGKVFAKRSYRHLNGVKIVLDAGHGGKDGGAKYQNINESQITLKITKQLQTKLEKAGARVILTRENNQDLSDANALNKKKDDMKKRIAIINEPDIDLFLSIHLNAYPNTSVKGAQAFYQIDNEVSRIFSQLIQKHLRRLTNTHMVNKPGDYYLLNNALKVGSLIECGFLSNPEDRALLITPQYQEKVANTLYDAMNEYFAFLQ